MTDTSEITTSIDDGAAIGLLRGGARHLRIVACLYVVLAALALALPAALAG